MKNFLECVGSAVVALGFAAELQSYRLICAERRLPHGFSGCSLWITVLDNRVYVATWVPHIYVMAATVSPSTVACFVEKAFADGGSPFYDFSSDVKEQFRLEEVSLDFLHDMLIRSGLLEKDENDDAESDN